MPLTIFLIGLLLYCKFSLVPLRKYLFAKDYLREGRHN